MITGKYLRLDYDAGNQCIEGGQGGGVAVRCLGVQLIGYISYVGFISIAKLIPAYAAGRVIGIVLVLLVPAWSTIRA
jgi:hypothetical protein